jgi:quinol monooxygenase YgiN
MFVYYEICIFETRIKNNYKIIITLSMKTSDLYHYLPKVLPMKAQIFWLLTGLICSSSFADIKLTDGTLLKEQPVWIVSYIEVKPNAIATVTNLIKQQAIVNKNNNENIAYIGLQRLVRDNHFALLEIWQDQASFNAQEKTKHRQNFKQALEPLLYSPYDQRQHLGLTSSSFDRSIALTDETILVLTHADLIRSEQFSPCTLSLTSEAPCGNQLLTNLTTSSHKHNGNIAFEILTQKSRTNHMTVMEIWSSLENQQAHQIHHETIALRYALTGIDKNKPMINNSSATSESMLGSLWDERRYRVITTNTP